MASDSSLGQAWQRTLDRIVEQAWFQQLKAKWDESDPRVKAYAPLAAAGLITLLALIGVGSAIQSVHSLKNELGEKTAILNVIQQGSDEMRRLRGSGVATAPGAAGDAAWPAFFEAEAGKAGIDKTAVSVSDPKAGTGMNAAKESLFDLSLKKVNARQVMRLAFFLENEQRPVKLRNLSIDTQADMSGYLDATLSVSAFTPKEP